MGVRKGERGRADRSGLGGRRVHACALTYHWPDVTKVLQALSAERQRLSRSENQSLPYVPLPPVLSSVPFAWHYIHAGSASLSPVTSGFMLTSRGTMGERGEKQQAPNTVSAKF